MLTTDVGKSAEPGRLLYVDWLRVLAIVGVFVIHLCSVFNPWDFWHIQNDQRSRLAGAIIVIMAPWIMPLLMLLAGVSAWYSLARRSNATFVRERVTRILIPLIVGTIVLVPPQVYLERRLRGEFFGSFWEFFPHFFNGIYPKGNLSWHHLWFLAHLFAYSLIALPIMRRWQSPKGRAQLERWSRVCQGPAGLLWLALPLLVERHLLWWLFPERHMLTSDWSNHALLFVAYLYGFILAGAPGLGTAIDEQWRHASVTAAMATLMLIAGAWMGLIPSKLPRPYAVGYLAFWTIYGVGAWAAIVAVLGAARLWLRADRAVLRFGRSRAYAWYILHQTVIVAFAYIVVQRNGSVLAKWIAIAVPSIAVTLLATELLRHMRLLRPFFGLGTRQQMSDKAARTL